MRCALPLTVILTSNVPSENNHSVPYPTSSTFTASANITKSQGAPNVSSSRHLFNPDKPCPQTFGSSASNPSNALQLAHSVKIQTLPHHSDSLQSSHGTYPATTENRSAGRKCKTDSSTPSSARALYLEKNRKAASKCRNKQKREQEDLVEEARKSEFKNRLLKAEVEMLRSDLNGLMDIVGLHAHCLDSRLTLYVQREADRLATGNMTSPPFPLPGNILQDTTSIYEQ
jgi:hypothetical protein